MLKPVHVMLSFLVTYPLLGGCISEFNESTPQVAFGTPHVMGDVELSYSVLVLGAKSGCTGTAIGPRHVITSADCLGPYVGLQEQKVDVVSFSGRAPEYIPAMKAIRHPREKVVWSQPFSLTNIASSDIALIVLERAMSTDGIEIAKMSQDLRSELKLTGFGSNESNTTNGRPRSARSKRDWKSARFDSGYGTVGFVKGDGAPCNGDLGAPAVSDGYLVGIVSSMQGKLNECQKSEFALLMDARLMRGWLKCSAQQLGFPLPQLSDAQDDDWCRHNTVKNFRIQ